MNTPSFKKFINSAGQLPQLVGSSKRISFRLCLSAAAVLVTFPALAFDFGPDDMFGVNGFGEVRFGTRSNQCADCQWLPAQGQSKQANWNDPIIPKRDFKSSGFTFWQIQPDLTARYNLGGGYKFLAALSQRWTNDTNGEHGGTVDVPNDGSIWTGYWYKKFVEVSHEDYGTLRVGHMTTQAWNLSDKYTYETSISGTLSPTGAGYGMLTSALRYTSRPIDAFKGTMIVEGTYDWGNTEFKVHTPAFLELYAKYDVGDLHIDGILQSTRNGTPSAWGQAPFTGLTPNNSDGNNPALVESSQGIYMLLARYQVDKKLEVLGGVRYNWWSGADSVPLTTNPGGRNSYFNVDWTLGAGAKGYPADSVDLMLGARYRMGKWLTTGGLTYFGTANTDNPYERGQSNSALVGGLGLEYTYVDGVKLTFQTGTVHYARLGLSPLSMGQNTGINYSDSRVSRDSNWFSVGMVFGF